MKFTKHSDPTPAEIAQMTAEFRRHWTHEEKLRRIVGPTDQPHRLRIVKTVAPPINDDDRGVTDCSSTEDAAFNRWLVRHRT